MARVNNSVVQIKNISSERFEHTYGGEPYSIEAGETLPFVYPVGMLLAQHLAMKLAREEAKKKGKLEGNDDKKATSLYTGKALEPYLSKIIVGTTERELPPVKSEGQIMKEKTVEMQRNFKKEGQEAPKAVDKKEVIAALKKLGVKFDPRADIETLLKKVAESQKNA